jgi:hypothetical protein
MGTLPIFELYAQLYPCELLKYFPMSSISSVFVQNKPRKMRQMAIDRIIFLLLLRYAEKLALIFNDGYSPSILLLHAALLS